MNKLLKILSNIKFKFSCCSQSSCSMNDEDNKSYDYYTGKEKQFVACCHGSDDPLCDKCKNLK